MTLLADEAVKMTSDLAEMRDRLRIAYQDLEANCGNDVFEQMVAGPGKAGWSSFAMPIDQRQAMVMWALRDSATESINHLSGLLSNVAACRTATGAEIREMWHHVTDRLGPEIDPNKPDPGNVALTDQQAKRFRHKEIGVIVEVQKQ
jgi:hypothetical protein